MQVGALSGKRFDDDGSADTRSGGRGRGRGSIIVHRDSQVAANIVHDDIDALGISVAGDIAHDLPQDWLELRHTGGHRITRPHVDVERSREVGPEPALQV